MLSTILFSIVTPDSRSPILLTALNNVANRTLLNPIFIKPEQVDHFLPWIETLGKHKMCSNEWLEKFHIHQP
jgi:hypothetical protein